MIFAIAKVARYLHHKNRNQKVKSWHKLLPFILEKNKSHPSVVNAKNNTVQLQPDVKEKIQEKPQEQSQEKAQEKSVEEVLVLPKKEIDEPNGMRQNNVEKNRVRSVSTSNLLSSSARTRKLDSVAEKDEQSSSSQPPSPAKVISTSTQIGNTFEFNLPEHDQISVEEESQTDELSEESMTEIDIEDDWVEIHKDEKQKKNITRSVSLSNVFVNQSPTQASSKSPVIDAKNPDSGSSHLISSPPRKRASSLNSIDAKNKAVRFINMCIELETPQVDGTRFFYLTYKIPAEGEYRFRTLQADLIKPAGNINFQHKKWCIGTNVGKSCSEDLIIDFSSFKGDFIHLNLKKDVSINNAASSSGLFSEGQIKLKDCWTDFSIYFKYFLSEITKNLRNKDEAIEEYWKSEKFRLKEQGKDVDADRQECLDKFEKYVVVKENIINELMKIRGESSSFKERQQKALKFIEDNAVLFADLDNIFIEMIRKEIRTLAGDSKLFTKRKRTDVEEHGPLAYLRGSTNIFTKSVSYSSNHSQYTKFIRTIEGFIKKAEKPKVMKQVVAVSTPAHS